MLIHEYAQSHDVDDQFGTHTLNARIPETKYANGPIRDFNSWGAPAMIAASKPTPAITKKPALGTIIDRHPTDVDRALPGQRNLGGSVRVI